MRSHRVLVLATLSRTICEGMMRVEALSSMRRDAERRSTIKVHPIFSEAPHVRGSTPRPKTGSEKKTKCILMNNSMARVYSYVIFRNKIGLPTILG